MRSIHGAACALLLGGMPTMAAAQCVVPGGLIITEVFYDAPAGDDGLEWVELRNDGTTTIQLTGQYSLGWAGLDYTFGLLDLQGSIAPGEVFVVGGPISNADNGMPVFQQTATFTPNMQNSGPEADGLALFNVPAASVTASTVPIDAVVYGPTNTNGLLGPDGTPLTPQVGDAPSGSSIELTDGGWQIQALPAPNQTSLAPPLSPLALSEVFYDASGADDNLEWVELFNRGTAPILLTGKYSLGAAGIDYTFDQYDLQGVVQPGETFVIGGPVSNVNNAQPVFDQTEPLFLQNSGIAADGLALFDRVAANVFANTVPVDSVIYGDSNDNMLIDRTGSAPAPDVADAPPGSSIELGTTMWAVQGVPTPNATPLSSTGCRAFADGFEL
ncbi:MAG: lamin tail domain-containing protein [Xanthomonadales bacterium]|nr:lamin tail domain-containing protein [Xanthomonadales bacterium]